MGGLLGTGCGAGLAVWRLLYLAHLALTRRACADTTPRDRAVPTRAGPSARCLLQRRWDPEAGQAWSPSPKAPPLLVFQFLGLWSCCKLLPVAVGTQSPAVPPPRLPFNGSG